MKCPRCQHENPPQSRFCFECGARLAPTCSSCGAELPAGVQFCNQCGQATAGHAPGRECRGAAGGAPRRRSRAGAAQATPRQAREPVLPGGERPDAGRDEGAGG
ncbi:MAG: zinc-ribbon domain-containing protein [Candidatus Rokubacteria bacterium]|nr:zinc-ribbon domain-containing protein [Candidatus Rokubacteria bacterium]